MRSALILAGVTSSLDRPAERDLSDGLLTAYEVTGLDLRGTELVNLTACKTALGDTGNGDGVTGLRSAFLLAGARSVIMSTWEVPVDETMAQMETFYDLWLAEDDPCVRYEAFRQAQHNLIASLRKENNGAAHPFYWAGFIYAGDPGDLPAPAQKK